MHLGLLILFLQDCLHCLFAQTLGVQHFEQSLELVYLLAIIINIKSLDTFLRVISELDEDHVECFLALSKVSQIHECGLGELVNGDIAQPHIEPLVFRIQQAREARVNLLSVQSDP